MTINLLPHELEPKGKFLKISKSLRKLALILVTLLIIASLSSAIYIFILAQQRKALISSQEKLEAEIEALAKTEQQLFLVKDRLVKIDRILGQNYASQEVEILSQNSASKPQGSIILSSQLKEDSAEMTFNSVNLADISQLLEGVFQQSDFQIIKILDFEFKPDSGYSLSLEFKK